MCMLAIPEEGGGLPYIYAPSSSRATDHVETFTWASHMIQCLVRIPLLLILHSVDNFKQDSEL